MLFRIISKFVWRCDTVNGVVAVCNKRYAYNISFKTPICNGSLGGDIEVLNIKNLEDLPVTKLAIEVTHKLGLIVAGIDIIEDHTGQLFILEVNPEPDILVNHDEFPDAIAKLLIKKVVEYGENK